MLTFSDDHTQPVFWFFSPSIICFSSVYNNVETRTGNCELQCLFFLLGPVEQAELKCCQVMFHIPGSEFSLGCREWVYFDNQLIYLAKKHKIFTSSSILNVKIYYFSLSFMLVHVESLSGIFELSNCGPSVGQNNWTWCQIFHNHFYIFFPTFYRVGVS